MKRLLMGTITAILLLIAPSCINDLNVESIDPNQSSKLNIDGVFAKIYATMGTTGSKGPAGAGDIAGIDEGTSGFYRTIFTLNEFPADQVYWIWPDVGVNDIRNATWNASNALVQGLYARLYFDITLCNLFLDETEQMQSEPGMTEKRAEVRFMRALNYYYLLDMYGNVPYVVSSKDKSNPQQIKRPALFEFVEGELLAAEEGMAEQRISYYRADKTAARLLLSRLYLNAAVYLDKEDSECKEYYDNAAKYADMVINSGYELAEEYTHLFMGDNDRNQASQEIILPIAQDGINIRSYSGASFLIASTYTEGMPAAGITEAWTCLRSRKQAVQLFFPNQRRNYEILENPVGTPDSLKLTNSKNNKYLMQQIEDKMTVKGGASEMTAAAKDARALFYNYGIYNDTLVYVCNFGIANSDVPFKSGWSIVKFQNNYSDGANPSNTMYPDMDVPFMRKAEAYLNYAEAVLRGGAQKTLTVDDAVNKLRNRADADPLSGVTLDDILDERGREFFCEGYRRSDLVRFGKFGGSNTGYPWEWKGGAEGGKAFDAFRNLYPIPNSDIVSNKNLKQNEGY